MPRGNPSGSPGRSRRSSGETLGAPGSFQDVFWRPLWTENRFLALQFVHDALFLGLKTQGNFLGGVEDGCERILGVENRNELEKM